ncbi:MAG: phage minor tail protein L [Alphaproteobacteria bacterium]|nr:phage minor tail protein L [Alphaproteobacteria bacterium]
MTSDKIAADIQSLEPTAIIELFIADLTALGDNVYRFHAGKNGLIQDIVWQGNTYSAYPVMANGFDMTGNGQIPRPQLAFSNVGGSITALILAYADIVGAKITRKRTLAKYLDAVNFSGGVNANADATAEFDDDIYYIDRKSREDKEIVEFELAAAFDVTGVKLPRRQIIQNICPWRYRGGECGYAGTNYFDVNDNSVVSAGQDVCGKRLSSCKARFGEFAELPYGGFPGAGLTR